MGCIFSIWEGFCMIIAYGKVFREIREEKGISVRETAKGIVSNSFLSKYELGKSNISFENLFLLLDRINCINYRIYIPSKWV